MRVKIRLQNHGVKNHKFWWIVAQPDRKNVEGRVIERLGYWLPRSTRTYQRSIIINKHRMRYWLSVGASPTNAVHRLLEKFDFVPPLPDPYGRSSRYERPEKQYPIHFEKRLKGIKGLTEFYGK